MSNRYTLKVYPKGRGREVYRVIEVSGQDNLEDLCSSILDAFEFDFDHLYEFNFGASLSDRSCIVEYEPYEEDSPTKIVLDKCGLFKGRKFTLLYDYGDCWVFCINVQKVEEELDYQPSLTTKEKGKLEQYPDYDDDWEDDEEEE